MSRVDPRSPLVLDVHGLSRRPGSSRTHTATVPAPPDLGTEVVGVPVGSPVDLQLLLEAVVEGVLVSGTVEVRQTGECVRCLNPVGGRMTVAIQELFAYPGRPTGDETARLAGDLLDLEPALRDAVVLALPFQPVCRVDCPGLCVTCGAELADDPGHRHDEPVDPRWAALAALTEPGKE